MVDDFNTEFIPDFILYADNVYRTKEFIVKQQLSNNTDLATVSYRNNDFTLFRVERYDVEGYKRFAVVQFELRKIILTEFILRNFFFHLRDTSIFNFAFRHWRSITRRNADKVEILLPLRISTKRLNPQRKKVS